MSITNITVTGATNHEILAALEKFNETQGAGGVKAKAVETENGSLLVTFSYGEKTQQVELSAAPEIDAPTGDSEISIDELLSSLENAAKQLKEGGAKEPPPSTRKAIFDFYDIVAMLMETQLKQREVYAGVRRQGHEAVAATMLSQARTIEKEADAEFGFGLAQAIIGSIGLVSSVIMSGIGIKREISATAKYDTTAQSAKVDEVQAKVDALKQNPAKLEIDAETMRAMGFADEKISAEDPIKNGQTFMERDMPKTLEARAEAEKAWGEFKQQEQSVGELRGKVGDELKAIDETKTTIKSDEERLAGLKNVQEKESALADAQKAKAEIPQDPPPSKEQLENADAAVKKAEDELAAAKEPFKDDKLDDPEATKNAIKAAEEKLSADKATLDKQTSALGETEDQLASAEQTLAAAKGEYVSKLEAVGEAKQKDLDALAGKIAEKQKAIEDAVAGKQPEQDIAELRNQQKQLDATDKMLRKADALANLDPRQRIVALEGSTAKLDQETAKLNDIGTRLANDKNFRSGEQLVNFSNQLQALSSTINQYLEVHKNKIEKQAEHDNKVKEASLESDRAVIEDASEGYNQTEQIFNEMLQLMKRMAELESEFVKGMRV